MDTMSNGAGRRPEHRPATGRAHRVPRTHRLPLTLLHALAALLAACLMALGGAASASAAPAADDLIKVFVVPDPARTGGQLAILQSIATATLGDASRAGEILALNQGQAQKDGGALNSAADQLHPGWILRLPQDASGPEVQLARDTGSQNSASAAPSSGQSAAPGTVRSAAFTFPLAAAVALLGAILLALITAGIVGRRKVRAWYAAVRRATWRLGEPMRRRRRLALRRATGRAAPGDGPPVRDRRGVGTTCLRRPGRVRARQAAARAAGARAACRRFRCDGVAAGLGHGRRSVAEHRQHALAPPRGRCRRPAGLRRRQQAGLAGVDRRVLPGPGGDGRRRRARVRGPQPPGRRPQRGR